MSRTELREASIRGVTIHHTLVLGSLQHYHPSHKPQKVMRRFVARLLPKVTPGMYVYSENCLERLENEIDDETDISSRGCSYNAIRKVP